MRFFDQDKVGVYLDDIGHRVENTKDQKEIKMIDLTLRVQPFTPALAAACAEAVRLTLWNGIDATQKPHLKTVEFKLPVPRQALEIFLLPESDEGQLLIADVEITAPRARTEKGVDGYGFVFYASFGPVSAQELEYLQNWYTQQRFITFRPQQPALDFAAKEPKGEPPAPRRRRAAAAIEPGDELRPGVHAEH